MKQKFDLKVNTETYKKGLEAYKNKNYEESIEHFSNAIKEITIGEVPVFYIRRGISYFAIQQYDKSLDDLNFVLNEFDDDGIFAKSDAYFYRGLIHQKNNQIDLALIDLNKCISINNNYLQAYTTLFFIYCNTVDDIDKKVEAICKIVELQPNASWHYEKGKALVEQNFTKNLNEIIVSCKKVIELEPHWFLGYYSMAMTYYQAEDYSSAILYFTKAIEKNTDEDFFYHRAICYKKTGLNSNYIKDINKSFELGSDKAKEEMELNKILFQPKNYIIFFDTETTGLPKNWNAPLTDSNNWPRIVQIAWELYLPNGQIIDSFNAIIKPDNFVIPTESSKVHGITTEIAYLEGQDLKSILIDFENKLNNASLVVAHNIDFDIKVVGAEYLRLSKLNPLENIKTFCTMQKSTNICKIKGQYGYKYPKLNELYYFLFNKNLQNAHNAKIDIKATAECYFELINNREYRF